MSSTLTMLSLLRNPDQTFDRVSGIFDRADSAAHNCFTAQPIRCNS